MSGWKTALILLLAVVALTVAAYFVSVYLKNKKKQELKGAKLSPKRMLHEQLCLELFKRNVFSGFSYPTKYSENGVPLDFTVMDTVAVTRGGIALISVKEYGGLIDDGRGDIWVCRHEDDDVEFDNPLAVNDFKRKVLLSMIKRSKLPDVPVYSIVVFTGSNVSFLTEYDNVVDLTQFYELIDQLNSERVLNVKEMFELREMLNREKMTRKQVQAHRDKIFGK